MTSSTITQEVLSETCTETKTILAQPNKNIGKGRYSANVLDKYAGKLPHEIGTDYSFKRQIVWGNVIGFVLLHVLGLVGVVIGNSSWLTFFWTIFIGVVGGEGITMGAHRFYAHKTFKAHFLVRLGLVLFQTIAGQNCMYIWVRDHRLHHKYSDTDADPHNANRGFFFSHMGWLMSRKHPAVLAKGQTIDMSDLEADSIVMFQKKYYKVLYLLFAVAFPVLIPVALWNEKYINSFLSCYIIRYIISLHFTWLVNSAAHFYGTKPYDETMRPVESWIVSLCSIGEGWHNYHHAFPWDYRASELGTKYNLTTMLIDFVAYLGLIYDRKSAPGHMVEHRALKKGDGSHPVYGPMKIEKEAEIAKEKDNEVDHDNNLKNVKTLEETIPPTNIMSKKDLEINHNDEDTESLVIKDASTGETTTVKRIVKEKCQTHG